MKISDVSAYALSSPIDPPQERRFRGGTRTLHKRDFVLVVVDAADGQRGFAPAGASSSAMREFFDGASQRTFAETIESDVGDALRGVELDDPSAVHDVDLDVSVPMMVESQGLSAIDVALHDIAGKRQGVPIYELLADGGDVTTSLPLYASAGMYMEPEGYAEQARLIADCGFFGYKYRPGIGPDGDRRTAELLREAVGDETELMADAHTWWKLEDTYAADERDGVVASFEDNGFYWLEEPVGPDDYDGYVDLADRTTIPLAGGESEESPEGLRELAETGAVRFLQGDVRHHRGYTGCRDAAKFCRDRDVQFVPHNFGTLLGLVANAHLVAGMPETQLLEYPVFEDDPLLDAGGDPGMYPFDLAFDIVEGTLDVADGHLTVPDGPGLGIGVNLDIVEEYPFIDGPWTTFEYDE